MLNATLDSIALDTGANTVTLVIDSVIDVSLSGTIGLAYITANGESDERYAALTMGNVSITTNEVIGDFGLSGTLTVNTLEYNYAAEGYERLDWTRVFDVDGDAIYEALNPGALLPSSIDLKIDFPATEHYLIAGSISSDPLGTSFLTIGTITLEGSAEFALTRWTVDVDTDGNGTEDLLGAQLDSIALDVSNVVLAVPGLATLTVDSGNLGLAYLTASGDPDARYAALTMSDVVVSASTNLGDFGLSGTLEVDRLEYNYAAEGYDRLDWTKGVDVNDDGFAGILDPGQLLTTPVDLTLDFPASEHYLIAGSISSNPLGTPFLTIGAITLEGSAEFALTRWTVDVDTDGNGTKDLLGAQLDSIALDVSNVVLAVPGLATLTVDSGYLGLAYLTASGDPDARYAALTMSDVVVSASTDLGDFGLSGTLEVDRLEYNYATEGYDRLDWTKGVDVNDNGFAGILDPGQLLTTPVNLTLDFPATEHFLIAGSITGTPLLLAGPIRIEGSAEFALTRWTVNVDTDGDGTEDLLDAQLDSIALDVSDASLEVTGLATLTVDSGYLGLAYLTASGETDVRYAALTMSDVVVSGSTANATDFGLNGTLEIDRLEYNYVADEFDRLDWNSAVDFDGDGEFETLIRARS